MTSIHKPRVDDQTYHDLLYWSRYIKKRTGKHTSVGAAIRWLASGRIKLKGAEPMS